MTLEKGELVSFILGFYGAFLKEGWNDGVEVELGIFNMGFKLCW